MVVDQLSRMLRHHEELNLQRRRSGTKLFISDYDGGHPFVKSYLGCLATSSPLQLGDITRYAGIDQDYGLQAKIAEFHRRYDDVEYAPEQIIPGGGSSSFLATLCTWLMISGHTRIHYLPPLYYKFAYFFQHYRIEAIPVSEYHAFQPELDLQLPNQNTVLIVSDPVWYGGRRIPGPVLDEISRWQLDTESLVFIDGTFQYMRWDGEMREVSATLPMDRTLRMISPTKYLSLHGYRCAYLLTPPQLHAQLDKLHINLHGDVPVSDRLFAHRAIDVMLDTGNGALIQHIQHNYKHLVDGHALDAAMDIETGFFLFARTHAPRQRFIAMDQQYFELAGYPGYVRINLLNNTAINALLETDMEMPT